MIWVGIYKDKTVTDNTNIIETKKPEVAEKKYFTANFNKLKLIDNTENKYSSGVIMNNNGCVSGINAFFYNTNNKPLGFLVIGGKKTGRFYKSSVLDGTLYSNSKGFFIQKGEPASEVDYGHQGGPVLITNYKLLISNLDSTFKDRRSVAIQTEDNQAVFAYFDDATLADLPQSIVKLGIENGFTVKNAINLDGGSAAAFWTKDVQKNELLMVGGFWCEAGI